ncbi:MAG: LPS assembly protein LptD [Proteobacteria bacterium]|nr:LPS assembly protein LptD [Pseudomonadota bacterium]
MRKLLSKNRAAALLSSVACLWAHQCAAGNITSEPWDITADKISRYTKPENIVAEGNVVLRRSGDQSTKPLTIKADWLRYNVDDGLVYARGNLSMRTAEQDVDAVEAVIDLNDETATLTDTTLFVPENNLHFSGHQVEKTGPITYRFKDGDFTTCKVEEGKSPPWQFHSGEAVLKLEKVAVLKHTVLRVKGVPVLYLPYMAVPANTKRKTGFLFPEISQSERSGTGFITPYFIDLSPSSDLTLYPGYLSKRGVVAGVEFRHVTDFNSKETIAATYIHDKTEDTADDDFKDDNYLRTDQNRYWIRGKLDHDFGNDLLGKIDLDLASDRDFLEEFQRGVNGFSVNDRNFLRDYNRGLTEETIPYRPSQMQLAKTWPSSFLGGQLVGINDLTDVKDVPTQVNTLPSILYSGVFELESMPLSLSWDSGYVHYWREEGVGEQRFDLHPQLTAPLPLGQYIEGTVTSGLRETAYRIDANGSDAFDWDYDREQNRTAWDFDANIATTVARDFDMHIGSITQLNHAIRPEIEYGYGTLDKEDELPDIDEVDLLAPENLITYSLNNYFRVAGSKDDKEYDRYLGYLKIIQSYDIHEDRQDLAGPADEKHPFSDVALKLNLYPLPRWQTRYKTAYSVYGDGVTTYDLYTRYLSTKGESASLNYRYTKGSEINQLNAEVITRLTDTWYLEADLKQSLDQNTITSASFGLTYHQQCWAIKFLAEKSSDDKRVAIMFSLVGLGQSLGLGFAGDLEGSLDLDSGGDNDFLFDQ